MPGDGGLTGEPVRFSNAIYSGPQASPAIPWQASARQGEEQETPGRGEERTMPLDAAAMADKPPGGIAVLTASPAPPVGGSERFHLRGTSPGAELVPLGTFGRPRLDLGTNLASGGPLPSKFLNTMSNWSYAQTELRTWLTEHRRQGQSELVIKDVTHYRIPWELFRLNGQSDLGLAGGYLGALLSVTRWLPLKPLRPEFVWPFEQPAAYQAAGQVVAYVAGEMEHDRELLRNFSDVDEVDSVEQVFDKLAERSAEAPGAALVYVACHGRFGDDPDDCELDDFPLAQATDYDDDLPRLRKQASLVFLNGCETGSVGVDVSKYNDGAVRGFAIVLLNSGAAGVLATTGAVGQVEAGVLAGSLFARLGAGMPVARGIRDLRAEAAPEIERLRKVKPDPEDPLARDNLLVPLLYPFMYVYYGSPRLLMSLTEEAAADSPDGPGPVV